ncbi:hypothetical protein HanRHA438_Chr13g0578281 [Helianthus annuus]|uniref:Uncharacterized protein n=1 Tax=Helianthus annuus TaxID=4232 RepID=A0A9K3EEP1_HELAN|nr:hypothetical protein HanXRQr2_Chr13g0566581 [Helianthus annuus]KAJ0847462.1 hypothetical protein HanPSC8_Chr13g0545601 [Helianthus annuus]KAJ0856419.1 hypothetical protein HanRHA438_Chr13g0578281 [Helianthus annuus]
MTVGQVRNWSADLGGIWLVYLASKLGNTWDSGRLGGCFLYVHVGLVVACLFFYLS